jgi:WD40 repeat protein
MKVKVDRSVIFIALVLIFLLPVTIVLLNKLGFGVGQTETETPVSLLEPTFTQLPTPPSDSVTDTAESIPTHAVTTPIGALEIKALSTNPPWLYFPDSTIGALRVLSCDGSEFMALTNLPPPFSEMHASSDGVHVAYVTCSLCTSVISNDNPDSLLNDNFLIIFNMVEEEVENKITLTSPVSSYDSIDYSELMDISLAVGSFSWSPDGKTLAFTASIDGVSSDLYVYDVEEKAISRLTWGPGQAYSPAWSPDGRWIVHQEVRQLTSALGARVDAVWASSLTDSNNVKVYDASGEHQNIKWWVSNTEFVVTHKDENPGLNRLYKASILRNELTTLYEGPIASLAMETNGKSAILWLMNDEIIFIKDPYTDTSMSLELINTSHLYYFEVLASYVISSDSGISFVSTEGEIIQTVDDSGYVVVAPDGKRYAIYPETYFEGDTGTGLRLYVKSGELVKEISSNNVDIAFWTPDGLYLYWVENLKLYNYGVEEDSINLVIGQLPELWTFDFSWLP